MEIMGFQDTVCCGELSEFYIAQNILVSASNLVIELREENGTLMDIACEEFYDIFRVSYRLLKPGNYKISILLNGHVAKNLDVVGANCCSCESMSEAEKEEMNSCNEELETKKKLLQTASALRAQVSAVKAERRRLQEIANQLTKDERRLEEEKRFEEQCGYAIRQFI